MFWCLHGSVLSKKATCRQHSVLQALAFKLPMSDNRTLQYLSACLLSKTCRFKVIAMHAGSIAGLQPPSINQTTFLDSKRQMPGQQQHKKDLTSQTEAVYVVAGNDAGLLHIWAGTGTGQHTWQPVAVRQQVCASPLSSIAVAATESCKTGACSCLNLQGRLHAVMQNTAMRHGASKLRPS